MTMQNSKRKKIKNGFFEKVYNVVKQIPKGKVATYGQIAKIIQNSKIKDQNEKLKIKKKINAKIVGWALHANKDPKIPCHRVVNKDGGLAENFGYGGWREQKRRLKEEGVEVVGRKLKLRDYLYSF